MNKSVFTCMVSISVYLTTVYGLYCGAFCVCVGGGDLLEQKMTQNLN